MTLTGRRVLYISYNGMLDPLGQSQVLPYLRELANEGVQFTLLSFERADAFTAGGRRQSDDLRNELSAAGIDWHWLRYHQKPSLPATFYDVAIGLRLARRLVRENNIELVHARSHIPATIALAVKRSLGIKMIFDVRGLMADEYVDAGHWRKGSFPYRLTKSMERRALASTDGIVTLTEAIWLVMKDWESLRNRQLPHQVVPCCADLERFDFSEVDRARRRKELSIEEKFVVVYSGSIDGWYLTEEMADFFVALRKINDRAHFLWLTPARHERVHALMRERNLTKSDYSIVASSPADVPSYLSASDLGLAFIKPCFSKLASSPTKYAEYLGCGLPLIINSRIGDSDELIRKHGVGAMVDTFDEVEYLKAATVIDDLRQNPEQARRRSREVAEESFDLRRIGRERYALLYSSVLNQN